MIRWNANFVRGLAESVLNRAKVIRTSLVATTSLEAKASPSPKKSKRKIKKEAVKRATAPGRRKRTDS